MYFNVEEFKEFTFSQQRLNCTANFVKPVHIVMMSCVYNYTDREVMFTNVYARAYARNMNYLIPLDVDTIDGQNHSKAIKLRDAFDNDSQVKKVMSIFLMNNYLDNETNHVLELIISELFQNFYAHAGYEKPPICCVQDWPSSNFLEISLADKGIGINESLRDVMASYPSDTNPCRIACNKGVSCRLDSYSKIGTKHSGYGLYFTKKFIEANLGKLFILSGRNCYINDSCIEHDHLLPYYWGGTVIRLVINKSNCVVSEEYFKNLSKELDGDNYDEFF